MTNFDDMVIGEAGTFTDAFSSTTEGIYYPDGRPAIPGLTITYDSKMFEPDALGENMVQRDPQVTIETAALPEKAKKDDRIEFNDIKVRVEHNEGDDLGITTLRVRVI